ncbi:hypothetical protein RvY_00450-2 [Ramazzottius varieornatus]|uniref:Uncharacterized protein n=1 Tax=Ramazzottius varieornatus TaxID=947166 RepID=A0A1D1UMR7_RAMVA|nr:hypothetical protein RvY_00450-2 [Ramazzottius varieornatus]
MLQTALKRPNYLFFYSKGGKSFGHARPGDILHYIIAERDRRQRPAGFCEEASSQLRMENSFPSVRQQLKDPE